MIISGNRQRSWREIHRRAARLAAGLSTYGIGEDHAIALLMRNDLAMFETNFAAAQLGSYAVPINWHFTAEEVAHILRDSGAKALVVHADLALPIRTMLAKDFPALKVLVVETPSEIAKVYGLSDDACRMHQQGTNPGLSQSESYDDFLSRYPPRTPVAPAARGNMIYTSGTTGKPKGVRRRPASPGMQQEAARMVAMFWELKPDAPGAEPASVLMNGPMYHSAPASYAMWAARAGLRIVLQARFDPVDMLQTIQRYRITHMHVVPTMFVRLLKLPEAVRRSYDVSSLRFVTHGAAPCAPHIKRTMIDWWGPVIYEYYGATETGVVVWHSSEEALRKPGTVGKPVPGGVVRIVDDQGHDVKQGEVGEIYLRASFYADFTYNNDDAKRHSIGLGDLVTVGDMGYLDSEGYLFVCDRKLDMIISGGVNIYPAEIEASLLQMRGVHDCAVFGIPDEEFGEAICAWIQPAACASTDAAGSASADESLSTDQVRTFLQGKLARYKIPKLIEFAAELPREDSGKIFKRKLREPYWQEAGRKI